MAMACTETITTREAIKLLGIHPRNFERHVRAGRVQKVWVNEKGTMRRKFTRASVVALRKERGQ